jgi:PST family polysaccharide transporter
MARLGTQRLARSAEVRNIAWLLGEYGVRVGLVFVTTALVARHLGPELLGSFGLLYTLITLIMPLTDAGLNHLVSRAIVAREAALETILGTASLLRVLSCLAGAPILVGLALAAGDGYPYLVPFAVLAGALNALSSLTVLDYYFQSQLRSRLSVVSRTAALAIISAAQLSLIALDAGVAPFLATLAVQQPLFGLIYYLMFRLDGGPSLRRWSFERRYAASLFRRSIRLTGANILYAVSMRSPVLLLAQFGTPASVGILSVATRPIDMLTVLPNAVGATLLPRFVRTQQRSAEAFDRLLRVASGAFAAAGLGLAVLVAAGAPFLVELFYGPEYEEAARVMQVYAPILLFIFFRGVISKWIITEERFNLSVFSQALSAATAIGAGLAILSMRPTAAATAAVLVLQAVADSVVALLVTRAGRAYLANVVLGRRRPPDAHQRHPDPMGSTTT